MAVMIKKQIKIIQNIFTSTSNQKNNEDKNNITMNLAECEKNIKENYGISDNDSYIYCKLFMKKKE